MGVDKKDQGQKPQTSEGKGKAPGTKLYPNQATKNFRTTDEELAHIRNQNKLICKLQITQI